MRSLCFATALLLLAPSAFAQAPIWGPNTYERPLGHSTPTLASFSAPDQTWDYTLVAKTMENSRGAKQSVSSAWFLINGIIVLRPDDFNQNTSDVSKSVRLSNTNTIEVRLTGPPGSILSVVILGPSQSEAVSPTGGSVNLPNFMNVSFPDGAFNAPTRVTLSVSHLEETGPTILRNHRSFPR